MLILLPVRVAMIVAAMLIAPMGLHDLGRSLLIFSAMSIVIAPIAAWRSLLIAFAFATSPGSRFAAVFRLWVSTSLLLGAIFTLLVSVLGYSRSRPGPSPRLGFLLADFSVSMLVSFGICGAFAAIVRQEILVRGAVISGSLMFLAVAVLGYVAVG
jgi:hypothetical protein